MYHLNISIKPKKGDITQLEVECIINAAGLELALACDRKKHYGVGEARITDGYNLPAKHVIHTVGPIWHGGYFGENQYLINSYK